MFNQSIAFLSLIKCYHQWNHHRTNCQDLSLVRGRSWSSLWLLCSWVSEWGWCDAFSPTSSTLGLLTIHFRTVIIRCNPIANELSEAVASSFTFLCSCLFTLVTWHCQNARRRSHFPAHFHTRLIRKPSQLEPNSDSNYIRIWANAAP